MPASSTDPASAGASSGCRGGDGPAIRPRKRVMFALPHGHAQEPGVSESSGEGYTNARCPSPPNVDDGGAPASAVAASPPRSQRRAHSEGRDAPHSPALAHTPAGSRERRSSSLARLGRGASAPCMLVPQPLPPPSVRPTAAAMASAPPSRPASIVCSLTALASSAGLGRLQPYLPQPHGPASASSGGAIGRATASPARPDGQRSPGVSMTRSGRIAVPRLNHFAGERLFTNASGQTRIVLPLPPAPSGSSLLALGGASRRAVAQAADAPTLALQQLGPRVAATRTLRVAPSVVGGSLGALGHGARPAVVPPPPPPAVPPEATDRPEAFLQGAPAAEGVGELQPTGGATLAVKAGRRRGKAIDHRASGAGDKLDADADAFSSRTLAEADGRRAGAGSDVMHGTAGHGGGQAAEASMAAAPTALAMGAGLAVSAPTALQVASGSAAPAMPTATAPRVPASGRSIVAGDSGVQAARSSESGIARESFGDGAAVGTTASDSGPAAVAGSKRSRAMRSAAATGEGPSAQHAEAADALPPPAKRAKRNARAVKAAATAAGPTYVPAAERGSSDMAAAGPTPSSGTAPPGLPLQAPVVVVAAESTVGPAHAPAACEARSLQLAMPASAEAAVPPGATASGSDAAAAATVALRGAALKKAAAEGVDGTAGGLHGDETAAPAGVRRSRRREMMHRAGPTPADTKLGERPYLQPAQPHIVTGAPATSAMPPPTIPVTAVTITEPAAAVHPSSGLRPPRRHTAAAAAEMLAHASWHGGGGGSDTELEAAIDGADAALAVPPVSVSEHWQGTVQPSRASRRTTKKAMDAAEGVKVGPALPGWSSQEVASLRHAVAALPITTAGYWDAIAAASGSGRSRIECQDAWFALQGGSAGTAAGGSARDAVAAPAPAASPTALLAGGLAGRGTLARQRVEQAYLHGVATGRIPLPSQRSESASLDGGDGGVVGDGDDFDLGFSPGPGSAVAARRRSALPSTLTVESPGMRTGSANSGLVSASPGLLRPLNRDAAAGYVQRLRKAGVAAATAAAAMEQSASTPSAAGRKRRPLAAALGALAGVGGKRRRRDGRGSDPVAGTAEDEEDEEGGEDELPAALEGEDADDGMAAALGLA